MNNLPPVVQNCKTPTEVKELAENLKNNSSAINGRRFSKGDDSQVVSISDLRQRLEQLTTHTEKVFTSTEIKSASTEIDKLCSRPNIFSRIIHLFTSIITGNRQRSNAAAKNIQTDIQSLSKIENYSKEFKDFNTLLTKQHQNNSPLQTHRSLFIKSVESAYRNELKSLEGNDDEIKTLNENFLTFLENSNVKNTEIKSILFDADGKAKPGALDLAKLATEKQQKKDTLQTYMRGSGTLDSIRNVFARTLTEQWLGDLITNLDHSKPQEENIKAIYLAINTSIKEGHMPMELKELLSHVQTTSDGLINDLTPNDPSNIQKSQLKGVQESNMRFFIFRVLTPLIQGSVDEKDLSQLMTAGKMTKTLSDLIYTPDKKTKALSEEDQEAIVALQKELLTLINS